MQFGTLLQELRVKHSFTQERLAEAAGISLSSLRNYEQIHRLPSWTAVVKLAKALQVSTDVFAQCDEVNAPEPEPEKPARKGKK